MKIAADFSQRAVVHSQSQEWIASPMVGVNRKPLDRVGAEVARATTIVSYDPGSEFTEHVHTGGEEFIVLEGVFQDEHGSFPAGSYIRNPPQSKHQPGSEQGCVMLVKLWQFQPEDRIHVRLQMNKMGQVPLPNHKGVSITPLYKDEIEEVSLLHFDVTSEYTLDALGGAELFILEGSIQESDDILLKHSWLRTPEKTSLTIKSGKNGAKVWVKSGHITDVENQISRVQNA
ncbi:cupin domain-containing protein [Psychromonas sp. SP041]|uniref:cupin domain-containing protein n=1 Tax=Psychromonas sp. SP041 TaxID=1365007 RepID=UPI0004177A2A|nr:cupin domain-containing protein [Psychromonas sp. SP041]